MRVRRVEDSKRWALFGIAVGTALYYGFTWRVAGNRWRSQSLVALAGFVPLAPGHDTSNIVQDTIPRKRYLSRLIFSRLGAICVLVVNRFRQRLRTLRAVSRRVVWINVFTMVLEDYRVGLVILVIVVELLTS